MYQVVTFPSFSKQVNWWQHYSAEAAAPSLSVWQVCKASCAEHPCAAGFALPEETGELQPAQAGIHGKVNWDLSKEMRHRAEFGFFGYFLMKIRLSFIKSGDICVY